MKRSGIVDLTVQPLALLKHSPSYVDGLTILLEPIYYIMFPLFLNYCKFQGLL
ncbi:hypothetical protein RAC83_001279 [Xylella fastidiosa]|nr:hypothetical protein [Xylella fastidiosa]